MVKKSLIINISILSILFIGNICIKDYNKYFFLIYVCLFLYNTYISYFLIKGHWNKHKIRIIFFLIISIILYPLTYFIICDPNPFFCVVVYYIFYPNFVKAILIVLIHTFFIYRLSTFSKKDIKKILARKGLLKKKLYFSVGEPHLSNFYFLSDLFGYFAKHKLKSFIIILIFAIFIRLEIYLFIHRIKFWVYLNNKENTLPIASSKNTTFYITATIFNMETIMPKYIKEMKKLINYLGKRNVIISIVENGDSEDDTINYLKEFQEYLNNEKIINRFLLEHEIDDPRKKEEEYIYLSTLRIKYYAELRNRCLDFLYELPGLDFDNTKIIFFNDVIFEYQDIINLLATNNEDYDAVCGMDFYDYFYDTWVSLDLNGYSLKYRFPFFVNKEAQDLVTNHRPVRVFSCWNGVTAFNASPLKNKTIQFRYRDNEEERKYRIHNSEHYNYESECTYFHIDLFSLGYTRTFVNPDVRFAYKMEDYYKRKYYTLRMIEFNSYLDLYFLSFTQKRNKYMSNYKEKNIKLNPDVQNWILENKKESYHL